jgi:hypothetical protein
MSSLLSTIFSHPLLHPPSLLPLPPSASLPLPPSEDLRRHLCLHGRGRGAPLGNEGLAPGGECGCEKLGAHREGRPRTQTILDRKGPAPLRSKRTGGGPLKKKQKATVTTIAIQPSRYLLSDQITSTHPLSPTSLGALAKGERARPVLRFP